MTFFTKLSALLLLITASGQAQQSPIDLGSAGNFVLLSKTGITDVPPSPITGNIGASPITGAAIHVSCAEVTGAIYAVDAAGPAPCSQIAPTQLTTAIGDMQTAYTDAAGRTKPDFTEFAAGNLSGKTLVPGLYKWSSGVSVDASGVTLSGGPNAVWIFQIAGDLILANTAHVTLAGGARAVNVFWQISGPTGAVLGTNTYFYGTILSAKQVILNTGATLIGRALAQTQVTLQSTTVSSPGALTGGVPPAIAPTVTSTSPVNGATNVAGASQLTATFSEPMDPSSITGQTFTLQNGAVSYPGSVTYLNQTATFAPASSLAPGNTFTATITTGAKDPSGVPIASNYVWTFSTATGATGTPPAVISTVPGNGVNNVPVGSSVSARFSKAMDPATITNATFTLQQGGASIPASVTYAGGVATLRPSNYLAPNTSYSATLTTGAKDLAGTGLASAYVWTFTTAAADTTPPAISSTLPAAGAPLVTTTADLVVNFSKPMNPLTVNTSTFLLQQGATPIAGSVTYAGTTATFVPAGTLAPNTLYTATITNGATDLAGNSVAGSYQWSFTTGAAAGQLPVCLANFAVLAGSAVNSTGATSISGDVGVSPGTSVTGFPPATYQGAIHAGDAAAAQAMADVAAAYADAVSRAVGPVPIAGDVGGQTFTAGLYRSAAGLAIASGNLTLDAKGDPNAVFIFQVASTLTTGDTRQVILAGGAQAFNVFWQVGTSASVGAGSVVQGSILADQSITLNTGAMLMGRLSARTGTITLDSSVITSPPPAIASGGIFNAASDTRTVAAGSIASIFGNNLSASLLASPAYPLATTLGGSSFAVGAGNAPLFMTSCSQVNLQIPWEAAGQAQVPVTATVGGLRSAQQPATLATFAPGIFTLNQAGTGQGAIEIAPTAQLAAPAGVGARPAKRGEYISIFGTGLGPVSNQPATGAAALSTPLSSTSTLPTVSIGGVAAAVTFSGLAPGFAGLYQVNAQVPDGVAPGDHVSLVLSIGGVASNLVTLAIQ